MTDKSCSIVDCTQGSRALGLCGKHYARMKRYGDPEMLLDRGPGECAVVGCGFSERRIRSLCPMHYARWRRYGDPTFTKHDGRTSHRLYHRWRGIIKRCTSSKDPRWERYGGRGIRICEEWANNFQAFAGYVESELGECPTGYSFDRIDNDGNYEPGNVRWASPHTQRTNQERVLPICPTCGGSGRVPKSKKGK